MTLAVRHERGKLFADVSLELAQGTDRAGNPQLRLAIRLQPGTGLAYREGQWVLLDEPATLVLTLAPDVLARMAQRAQASKSGRSKWGPIVAQRTLRAPKTRREP